MRVIRFRRLSDGERLVKGPGGIVFDFGWEIALSEADLARKLDGDMAEVHMPAKPWYVRLWRRFRPLRGVDLTPVPCPLSPVP